MAESTMTTRIKEQILSTYEARREHVAVSVQDIAHTVFETLDPVGQTPFLIRHCAILELRQMTRELLRLNTEKESQTDDPVVDMFGFALQRRYPVERNGSLAYVLVEHLTYAEGKQNVENLKKEQKAKGQHADALDAYLEFRKARGDYDALGT
jgi:hypothetical protein